MNAPAASEATPEEMDRGRDDRATSPLPGVRRATDMQRFRDDVVAAGVTLSPRFGVHRGRDKTGGF